MNCNIKKKRVKIVKLKRKKNTWRVKIVNLKRKKTWRAKNVKLKKKTLGVQLTPQRIKFFRVMYIKSVQKLTFKKGKKKAPSVDAPYKNKK
jgi:hypothetical protein